MNIPHSPKGAENNVYSTISRQLAEYSISTYLFAICTSWIGRLLRETEIALFNSRLVYSQQEIAATGREGSNGRRAAGLPCQDACMPRTSCVTRNRGFAGVRSPLERMPQVGHMTHTRVKVRLSSRLIHSSIAASVVTRPDVAQLGREVGNHCFPVGAGC